MRERRIIAALLAQCKRFETKAGHLAMTDPNEHLGVCNTQRAYDPNGGRRVPDGTGFRIVDQPLTGACSPLCAAFTSAVAEAQAYLDETASTQLTMLEAAS